MYENHRRNFITDLTLLERVTPLKAERWRLGNERSEDALSWNVFMGLSHLDGLKAAFQDFTGIEIGDTPELYLWGVKVPDEQPKVWDRLKEVRRDLRERGIPTEPDIILRANRRAIVLIEAKFGSPNGILGRNQTVAEFLSRYPCKEGARDPLNREWIENQSPNAILQQLVRNVIFAQRLAENGEEAFVVNLVRGTEGNEVEVQMKSHLAKDGPVGFRRATWEGLFQLELMSNENAAPLRKYLVNKTNKLVRAFNLEGILSL